MSSHQDFTVLAFNRFGLGARPGDLYQVRTDPRRRLLDEIEDRTVPIPTGPELLDTRAAMIALYVEAQKRRTARTIAYPFSVSEKYRAESATKADSTSPVDSPLLRERPVATRLIRAEAMARITLALDASVGFAERLVWFWANHFAVSAKKGPIGSVSGAFEREAIRPHVLGRFSDMLLAAEMHPAMLYYLDNQGSIGPNSVAGQRKNRGMNENFAREIMELHTLGANSGYSQSDVTSLARILTGWTVTRQDSRLGLSGNFVFNPAWHEPNTSIVLGRRYPDTGVEQGRAVLLDLARSPATARHLAFKIARHFVADDPPSSLVARLTNVFMDTDGNLSAVSRALIDSDDAWKRDLRKMRSPREFLTAALRMGCIRVDQPSPYLEGLQVLGQPLWEPPGPDGFPDTVAHWASPEGLTSRLDLAARMSKQMEQSDPAVLLDEILGTLASTDTRRAVLRADSREQGVAILLMSPEFQRR